MGSRHSLSPMRDDRFAMGLSESIIGSVLPSFRSVFWTAKMSFDHVIGEVHAHEPATQIGETLQPGVDVVSLSQRVA